MRPYPEYDLVNTVPVRLHLPLLHSSMLPLFLYDFSVVDSIFCSFLSFLTCPFNSSARNAATLLFFITHCQNRPSTVTMCTNICHRNMFCSTCIPESFHLPAEIHLVFSVFFLIKQGCPVFLRKMLLKLPDHFLAHFVAILTDRWSYAARFRVASVNFPHSPDRLFPDLRNRSP